MVVKETLRLHPGGPFITRESNRDRKIDGSDIYPETKVLINAWAIGRNPKYWKNPLEFSPERFKDSSIDFVGTQNFDYLPFRGGRRVCPAINMGIVLTELILANVLYTFDWGLPKGSKLADLNMKESPGSKYPLQLQPIKHIYG
ncbi:cytochrome P450 71B2-like [Papaver somniferum]|uniref:cytochrome P450 71B2-like n=1 Tax=Papaver somniferum TaxID=3469 RepID=UPI000E6F715E|nr:cytochrome P450 71B2-like [Papaver somniferum]